MGFVPQLTKTEAGVVLQRQPLISVLFNRFLFTFAMALLLAGTMAMALEATIAAFTTVVFELTRRTFIA